MENSMENIHADIRVQRVNLTFAILTDIDQLSDAVQVQAVQNKTRNALEEYIRVHRPQAPSRFGQLLIKITSLGAVDPTILEHVFFNELIGGASINGLVDGILRANSLAAHANVKSEYRLDRSKVTSNM